MTTRPYFLDPTVKLTVTRDNILMAMWVATRDTYDADIDPLHRPAWVADAQAKEKAHLDALQVKRAHAHALTTRCPQCDAKAGETCNYPGSIGAFHRERLVRAIGKV